MESVFECSAQYAHIAEEIDSRRKLCLFLPLDNRSRILRNRPEDIFFPEMLKPWIFCWLCAACSYIQTFSAIVPPGSEDAWRILSSHSLDLLYDDRFSKIQEQEDVKTAQEIWWCLSEILKMFFLYSSVTSCQSWSPLPSEWAAESNTIQTSSAKCSWDDRSLIPIFSLQNSNSYYQFSNPLWKSITLISKQESWCVDGFHYSRFCILWRECFDL